TATHAVHQEVAAALPGGGGEPEGGRRRALHLSALSTLAVEGAAYDERPRAHQRGVPPAHEDASESSRAGRRRAAALRIAPQRPDQTANARWLSGYERGKKGSVVTSARRLMTRLNFSTT